MKYCVMSHICDAVNAARKSGTWESGYWRSHGKVCITLYEVLSQTSIGHALDSAKRGFIKMTKRGTPILQSKYAKLVHFRRVQAQDRRTKYQSKTSI